jgi:hypothetical protein
MSASIGAFARWFAQTRSIRRGQQNPWGFNIHYTRRHPGHIRLQHTTKIVNLAPERLYAWHPPAKIEIYAD